MKKNIWISVVVFVIFAMLTGCVAPLVSDQTPPETTLPNAESSMPTDPTEPSSEPTEPTTEPATDGEYEGDASTHYIKVVYAEQIRRYYNALSQKWSEAEYAANGMCALSTQYYEGNPLNHIGFAFVDLNNDGYWELIFGAIRDAATDPLVFEIWTLVDGKPVMVAQSDAQNRYYLQYSLEDNAWYVAQEITKSADQYGKHYLMLQEGKFEVVQAIIYDAAANPAEPWFMAYDTDMDTSNDMSVSEKTAKSIVDSNRKLYMAADYFPYILYS